MDISPISAPNSLSTSSPTEIISAAESLMERLDGTTALLTPPSFYKDGYVKKTLVTATHKGERHYCGANWVGPVIATSQWPQEKAPLFWSMCFEHSSLILDLTNSRNDWPSLYAPSTQGAHLDGEDFKVICEEKLEEDDGKMVDYTLRITGPRGKKIVHRVHYTDWEDRCGTDPSVIAALIQKVQKLANGQAVIVHCLAGVGRTGTFISAWKLNQLIEERIITDTASFEDKLFEVVMEGRKARDPDFVTNVEQIQALLDFGKWRLESKG